MTAVSLNPLEQGTVSAFRDGRPLETGDLPRDEAWVAFGLYSVLGICRSLRTIGKGEGATLKDDGSPVTELELTIEAGVREKEDGILFRMADQVLPPEEHERLEEAYRTAIPNGADAGTGTRYEELARALCERWQIDPDERRSLPGGFGCH